MNKVQWTVRCKTASGRPVCGMTAQLPAEWTEADVREYARQQYAHNPQITQFDVKKISVRN